jgi:hypothetical protein
LSELFENRRTGDADRNESDRYRTGNANAGTITVCDAQAFAAEEGKERLVATMTGALMALFGREGIAH